jgi:hypothetical protein
MSYENTQRRAYAIWEKEGRPEGRHLRNWEQAISDSRLANPPPALIGRRGSRPTFCSPPILGARSEDLGAQKMEHVMIKFLLRPIPMTVPTVAGIALFTVVLAGVLAYFVAGAL